VANHSNSEDFNCPFINPHQNLDRKDNMQNFGHKTTKKKLPFGREKMKGTHEDDPMAIKCQDRTT
jgi:hypothetical protein